MNREEIKKFLRTKIADYLCSTGRPIDGSRFRCINPGHPKDNTPSMGFFAKGNRLHCFGCSKNFDIFDAIKFDYNLQDFNAQLQKACELFNIVKDKDGEYQVSQEHKECTVMQDSNAVNNQSNSSFKRQKEASTNAVYKRNIKFIEESKKNRDKAKKYLEHRGINTDLADTFELGVNVY